MQNSASSEMEEQYLPAAQTKEFLELVGHWERDAAAYRQSLSGRSEMDVAYGEGEAQKLDFFFPEDRGDGRDGSVVVFIHGGYWQTMGKSFFSHYARGANAHGLTVAVVAHTLAPHASMDAIVKEVAGAVAFVARRFDKRVTVCGHSSGGHLAACVAADRWADIAPSTEGNPISAALIVSGLFDLEPLLATSLNAQLGLDVDEARRLSPVRWSPASGRPISVYVGARESSEFRRQTREFAETWQKKGAKLSAVEVPDASHFSVAAPLTDPESPIVRDLVTLART